ncbi:hypothetical protein Vretimale_5445 [Volvox reticuliferus]|uniref:Uncharacterized protein n=1 Tax=Volvox reticuliferus TaxID=1737510 RepID=A0A8J4G5A2_9CHLO|nr:hypothetical protein Vretifemale_3802 [Volvox reticuliferus]GIM00299.1 hypothetical protein Vretimale_5445 [Volvox reticuliferus]
MARVVEVVQIFKKVEDVTAAKEDPSPVYLMDELAEMARGSAESSEKIADRIAKRLQNKSPVVKFKALRLIRHLVNKGCAQFQRTMQRHASLIREHIQFKGEPDPFKGDAPNQRVRDAAKEASEALFNTVTAQPVTSLGSRIQGFGSSAAPPPSSGYSNSVSGSGASASGSRMVGFGSSGYSAPAAPASTNGSAGLAASSSSLQKGVNRPLTGSYADAGSAGTGTGSTGGFGAGGYTAPAVVAAGVLGSEAQLVDGICTPGGLRLAPDAEDLRRFVEAAGNLDGIKLAELLREKMDGSGQWQQQLRAMYALEAVLVQGASQACGEVAVMFQSDPGPLQAATGHTQPAVRERASRVLKLLLGNDPVATIAPAAAAQTAPAAAPAAPAQTTADLLGGLDMLGGPVQGGYTGHQQQSQRMGSGATAGGADDIFSGLTLGTSTSPQQVPIHQQLQHQAVGGSSARPGFLDAQQQHQAAPVVDPFPRDMPHLTTVPHPQAAYTQQQNTSQWQQQQQNLQQAHGVRLAGGGGLVGVQEPMAATTAGPALGTPHGMHLRRSDIQPSQAAGVRPPLDDMFADMSLSSNSRGERPGQNVVAGSGYGNVGNAYGGVGPAYGGGIPGGGTGYGNPAGPFGPGASQMSLPSSSSVGMMSPTGAIQYAAPHSMSGMGGGSSLPHTQAQLPQQMARVTAPTHTAIVGTADTRGGMDLLGPGPSGTVLGKGAGAYGPGVGSGAGPGGGLGMGAYPAANGVATNSLGAGGVLPHGVVGSGTGGMMVGPGGQVLYVGGNVQPSTMMGPTGNMGPANGQLRQHTGSWQPTYAMQQQQPLSSGVSNPHQDQRGGAAFDFVREQFR